MLPRKISFHGYIISKGMFFLWKRCCCATGAKLDTCLVRISLRLHPPQKILACLSLSKVILLGRIRLLCNLNLLSTLSFLQSLCGQFLLLGGGGGDGEQGSLSTGGSSSDSVTGLGSWSSDENEYVLESPDGPNILSEKPPGSPSQEDLSVIQRVQVNPEPNSLGIESNLPLKGNQNINETASNNSVKKGQLVSKRKILRSLRNFPYELINYS